MNIELRLRTADRDAVVAGMCEGTVLVEFVRYDECDFNAVAEQISEAEWRAPQRWKAARYAVFVLRAGKPQSVEMIDLGEAGLIDRLIADFRQSLSGPDDRDVTARGRPARGADPQGHARYRRALCRAVFDPIVGAARRIALSALART